MLRERETSFPWSNAVLSLLYNRVPCIPRPHPPRVPGLSGVWNIEPRVIPQTRRKKGPLDLFNAVSL